MTRVNRSQDGSRRGATLSPQEIRITRYDSFEEARDAWLAFESYADHYAVQGYHWLAHWQDKVGRVLQVRPCLILIQFRDQPLMLLPLGVVRKSRADCLVWLGGEITDYHAPLLHPDYQRLVAPEDFQVVWNQTLKHVPRHDAIHLEKQPEWVARQRNPFLLLPDQRVQDVNLYCVLDDDWVTFYERNVRAQLRADSRRKRKRLEEIGVPSFAVASNAAEIRQITECMIIQKRARYVDTRTYDLFRSPEYREFFLSPSRELFDQGILHVSALRLDDEIIAAHWGLVFGRRLYYLMASFDARERGKYSPGRLMLEHLFHWCFQHDLEVLDFTIGDEDFKRQWSNRRQTFYEYTAATTMTGTLYAWVEALKRLIRRQPNLHKLINRLRNFDSRT